MTATTAETTPVDDAALHVLIAAELGLLSVGVATALSFSRLFVPGTYLVPLVGAVAASWTIAVLTRRLHLGVWTSALISAMCAVLVLGWRFAPHTTVFGLPTPDTASTLLDAVRSSFAGFSTMVAPVRASDGFLVVLAPVMWTFTFFADAAALRYRGPVQAVIPDVSAFVAGGVLARETARSGTAVVFVAGLSVYALTQRLLHSTERRWASGDERRGVRSIAASGFVVVGVAVVAGALIGPHLPGDSAAVLDLRAVGRASSPRTVTSPFVGVRNLLGPQSDEILFTAQASVPAYWRLTSLDRYDATRDIWVSSTSYRDVDGADLPASPTGGRHRTDTQVVTISGLTGPWVPAAFAPRAITIDTDISFDEQSSSIIANRDRLQVGTQYRVTSAIPAVRELDLTASRGPDGAEPTDLDPAGLSSVVRETARDVAGDAPTPYLQALALQNWFRSSFTYDTDVDFSSAADPVAEFLDARTGFCAQFSSTYALMARSIGLPARVAVGFTPGDLRQDPSGTRTYVVRGRHAHAWPEVYFRGVGWVPFEPTPGRGNPGATDYTGVPAQQAEPPPSPTPASTTVPEPFESFPTPSVPGAPPTTTATTTSTVPTTTLGSATPRASTGEDRRGWVWALPAALLAAGGLAAWAAVARRRRRPAAERSDTARISHAWRRASADLAAIGLAAGPSETPLEFAQRTAAAPVWHEPPGTDTDTDVHDLATRVGAAMRQLGSAETIRRYGPAGADEVLTAQAEASADVVRDAVRTVATTRQRVRQLVG